MADIIHDKSEPQTKIISEGIGKPTVIGVPSGFSALILTPDGEVDFGLLPAVHTLERGEDGEVVCNDGMVRLMCALYAMRNRRAFDQILEWMAQDDAT